MLNDAEVSLSSIYFLTPEGKVIAEMTEKEYEDNAGEYENAPNYKYLNSYFNKLMD